MSAGTAAREAIQEALPRRDAGGSKLPPSGDPVAVAQRRVKKMPLRQRGRSGSAQSEFESKIKRTPKGRTGGGQFATKSEQEKLKSQQLYDGKADGIHGPKTTAAVKAFQRKYGLEQTGRMDERTRLTLQSPPPLTREQARHSEASQDKMRERREKRAQDAAESGSGDSGRGGSGRSRSSSRSSSREEPEDQSAERQGALAGGEPLRRGQGMDGKRKRGDKRVRVLQQWLLSQGYDLGDAGVDGKFGPATERAVKRLQGDLGLKQDGVVGSRTRLIINLLRTSQRKADPGLDIASAKLSEAGMVTGAVARKLLEGKDSFPPTQAEREQLYARFGRKPGVALRRDKRGLFVHTHRARSASYPAVDAIPASVVEFIESTG